MEPSADTAPELDRDRLLRLIEVGRSLTSELDLDTVLDRLLETARELTGARYAALGILDERRAELAQFLTRGIDPAAHADIGDLPRGRGILGVLIDEPRPVRLPDVSRHARSYGFPPGHPPMHSFLGVPIVIGGEAWGNLYLTEKHDGELFTEADETTCVILSDWAAIAIANARLYQRAQGRRHELERAVRGFEATAAIAQAVGGETDLNRILELIVKRGRALVEARTVVILLPQGERLCVAAGAGELEIDEGAAIPLGRSTAGEVLRAGTARRVRNAAEELRVAPVHLGVPDARSALMVPLVYRGRSLGVLVAFDRLTGDVDFTGEDEQVLEAFAASAATAVATAQTVEAERLRRSLEAAEQERSRWARELHDETLQGLGALRVLLSGATRARDLDTVRASLGDAVEHVGREIDNLRAIIAELRPAALDQLGLRPALETLMERTASTHGLEVRAELDLDDDERLAPELETTIYRVVQEALTNAGRHAQASAVDVRVARRNGEVEVRVADDGHGFDPDEGTGGFGLTGMRERVALAGGELRITPAQPGTEVWARLPAAGQSPPDSRS